VTWLYLASFFLLAVHAVLLTAVNIFTVVYSYSLVYLCLHLLNSFVTRIGLEG
jgi:hypothetical protein